jgi:predicted transcriptional regulator
VGVMAEEDKVGWPRALRLRPPPARLATGGARSYNASAFHVQKFELMPETTFTFRVDQGLKKAFTEAARANDRPGSQLLRDFMRDYVDRSGHDAWFRAEIEQSLKEADDPNVELVPHEEVVRNWQARRGERIKNATRKRGR